MTNQTHRNLSIDIMKGIAILLMIWEHYTTSRLPYEQAFVYSFHIPLFFLVGGYLAKDIDSLADIWRCTKKNAIRLLLPIVVTMLAMTFIRSIHYFEYYDWQIAMKYVVSQFLPIDKSLNEINVGPMWFLLALFWTREFFMIIQYVVQKYVRSGYREILILICGIILSLLAQRLYPTFHPLCIMQGICGLVFYVLGMISKRHQIPWMIITILILCWPFSVLFGHVELMECAYNFPLDIMGSCGATYLLYQICNSVYAFNCKYSWLKNSPILLRWCGIYSLPILCVHSMERQFWSLGYQLPIEATPFDMVFLRILLVLIVSVVIVNVPYLKKLFGVV